MRSAQGVKFPGCFIGIVHTAANPNWGSAVAWSVRYANDLKRGDSVLEGLRPMCHRLGQHARKSCAVRNGCFEGDFALKIFARDPGLAVRPMLGIPPSPCTVGLYWEAQPPREDWPPERLCCFLCWLAYCNFVFRVKTISRLAPKIPESASWWRP